MDSLGLELYKVRKKDGQWANESVSSIRRDWRQLYPTNKATRNRSYNMCMQDMKDIEKKFKKSSFKESEMPFHSLPIMHKIINELAESLIQSPPKCEVKATDATAVTDRKRDMGLLQLRKTYEAGLNRVNYAIGEPPTTLDLKKKGKSNIADFDKLGLDESDQEDLSVFEMYLQRMNYEISAQSVVNNVFKVNKFDELNLREALIDIASTVSVCYDTYVDSITGQFKIDKIEPEYAWGIWGNSYDGHDDAAKGWEKPMTLRSFLGVVGDKFDMRRDFADLVWAINNYNGESFTGFNFGRNEIYDTYGRQGYDDQLKEYGCNKSKLMSVNEAYNYNIYFGKVQWYTLDMVGTGYLVNRKTGEQNVASMSFYNYQVDEKLFTEYEYKSETRWVCYEAIYLAQSMNTQKIYKWGEVYLQQPEGAYDEYCIGTLKYYRLPGLSIAEVAKPYIDLANEVYYKIKWIIDRATPRKRQLVFNEIIAMARALGTDKGSLVGKDGKITNDVTDGLEKVFDYLEDHVEYDIRFYPQVRGVEVPQLPSLKAQDEGMDPLAVAMQLILQWAESMIADKIGLNDLRMGNVQKDREPAKMGQMETSYSLNKTGYISRMIQYVKRDVATACLTYTHDVIKYKQSIACKWLQTIMGEEAFAGLSGIENLAPHRIGIFINDYYTAQRKKDIDQAAGMALQKGENGQVGGITLDQWFAITSMEDYKREMKLLSIFRRKEDKKKRARDLQDQKAKMDHEKQMEQEKQKTEQIKGNLAIEKEKVIAEAQKYVADKNYERGIDVKKMTVESEPDKQANKSEAQKQIIEKKDDLKNQEPFK